MAAQLTGLQHQAIRVAWLELFRAASSSTAVEGQPMPRYFRDLAAFKDKTFHAADVIAAKIACLFGLPMAVVV